MTKAVRFTIELEYDLNGLRFMTDRDISAESFVKEAEDYARHDLTELLRSNEVSAFARVTEFETEAQNA